MVGIGVKDADADGSLLGEGVRALIDALIDIEGEAEDVYMGIPQAASVYILRSSSEYGR